MSSVLVPVGSITRNRSPSGVTLYCCCEWLGDSVVVKSSR